MLLRYATPTPPSAANYWPVISPTPRDPAKKLLNILFSAPCAFKELLLRCFGPQSPFSLPLLDFPELPRLFTGFSFTRDCVNRYTGSGTLSLQGTARSQRWARTLPWPRPKTPSPRTMIDSTKHRHSQMVTTPHMIPSWIRSWKRMQNWQTL